jgi:hypothetical protein
MPSIVKGTAETIQVDTNIDLTGLSSATVEFQPPDGSAAKSVAATATGTPTDGLLDVVLLASTLDQRGDWVVRALPVFASSSPKGKAAKLTVLDDFEVP